MLLLPQRLGVVGAAGAFGDGVAEQAIDGGVREFPAAARAVALLVQEPRHGLLPLVLKEEFVHQLPDRRLLRVRHQLPILPLVAERRSSPQRLPKLGADRNRGGDALGDLLALPLRHGGDHGVEEAAGGGGGVDGLLEGDEIRVGFPEKIGEVEQLAGVPSEPRQL